MEGKCENEYKIKNLTTFSGKNLEENLDCHDINHDFQDSVQYNIGMSSQSINQENELNNKDNKHVNVDLNVEDTQDINNNLDNKKIKKYENKYNNKLCNKVEDSENFECYFCKKNIVKSKLTRHIINSCKMVPNFIRNNYINKFNNNGNTKQNNLISLKDDNDINIQNIMNNLNNVNINNISDFDNDDYSHLTEEDMLAICESGFKSYTMLTDLLLRNEKNINYMIKNVKDNDVYVIKNNKIDIISKMEFKETKLDRSVIILTDIFIRKGIRAQLSEKKIRIFEDVIDMDKYREALKYNQYADELFLQLKKFNPRNKKIFKKKKLIEKLN